MQSKTGTDLILEGSYRKFLSKGAGESVSGLLRGWGKMRKAEDGRAGGRESVRRSQKGRARQTGELRQ